ncbi:hypothetical protein AAC387_Pa07g2044 [Persea americana]
MWSRCKGIQLQDTSNNFPNQICSSRDLGQTEWTASTLAHIRGWDHAMLLLRGDLLYVDGQQPLWTRVYDNSVNPCGPIHVTIGDGGNREGLALQFKKPTSPLSMFHEAIFGHGRLTVLNQTHTHWTWHHNNDSESTIGDEVWLESLSGSDKCNA